MLQTPLVTLFVYAYNHEAYVGSAIDAAFSQTYTNLEIILSDDHSTDNTYEIMREKAKNYNGSHKIILNRNNTNLGISGHLNKIMTLGSGKWFVLAAGDDISNPERVEVIMESIKKNPEIMSVNSGYNIIDQNETVQRYHGFDKKRLYVTGATGAWNRKVFDYFGPITQATTAEDVVIPFRALLLGKLLLIGNATIYYREHNNSVSSPTNAKNIDAQKHLKKICFQLINACNQRLIDLEKAKNKIPAPLYLSLKKKHQNIIEMLQDRIENINKTIEIFEASWWGKAKYIFTSSTLKKHQSFLLRIKQILLSFDFIRNINKKRTKSKSTNSVMRAENNFLIDLKRLDIQKDLLIYL